MGSGFWGSEFSWGLSFRGLSFRDTSVEGDICRIFSLPISCFESIRHHSTNQMDVCFVCSIVSELLRD